MPRAVVIKRAIWAGIAAVVAGLGFLVFLMSGPGPSREDAAPARQVKELVPETPPVEQPPADDVKGALESALKPLADEAFREELRELGADLDQQIAASDPFDNKYRRLARVAVENETIEEMVANLRDKIVFWNDDAFGSADELLEELATDPRIERLLAIARDGTAQQRQAILDQVKEMCRVYLEELPDFDFEVFRPTVVTDGGGHPYPYLLAQLDDDGAVLDLIVAMYLRNQQAHAEMWKAQQKAQQNPARDLAPGEWVMSGQGAMFAYAAADCLSTYLARPELQDGLKPAQRAMLDEFQAYLDRHNGEPNYSRHEFFILQIAVGFVEAGQQE